MSFSEYDNPSCENCGSEAKPCRCNCDHDEVDSALECKTCGADVAKWFAEALSC